MTSSMPAASAPRLGRSIFSTFRAISMSAEWLPSFASSRFIPTVRDARTASKNRGHSLGYLPEAGFHIGGDRQGRRGDDSADGLEHSGSPPVLHREAHRR